MVAVQLLSTRVVGPFRIIADLKLHLLEVALRDHK